MQFVKRYLQSEEKQEMPVRPKYFRGNSRGEGLSHDDRDVADEVSSPPLCSSRRGTPLQKQQASPASFPSNMGSPLMYAVYPATRDESTYRNHTTSSLYSRRIPMESQVSNSALQSSTIADAGMHTSNNDASLRYPVRSRKGSIVPHSLPRSKTHSPDQLHRRRQQRYSIAASSPSSPIGFVPNEALDTQVASTTFGDTYCGALMTSTPHHPQEGGNDTRREGYVTRAEKVSHPNTHTQSEVLSSSLPAHPENVIISRMVDSSPIRRSLDGMHSPKQQERPAPQRHAPATQVPTVSTSSSVATGGSRPLGVPTAVDGCTIVSRRYGENNSPALNISPDGGTFTVTTSVAHRPASSSSSWPHEAPESTPFTRAEASSSSHSGWRVTVPPSGESTSVVRPKKNPPTTSTPQAVGVSAQGNVSTDPLFEVSHSFASPLRAPALAQIQSPMRLSSDSQSAGTPVHATSSPHERRQLIHSSAVISSSPPALKSPAMFGVIDLSYSRTDAGSSKMTLRVSSGSTVVGANAVAKPHMQASTSRAPMVKANPCTALPPRNSPRTTVTTANYKDPALAGASFSSTTATPTVDALPQGSMASGELAARCGTTTVRMGHSAGRSDGKSSTMPSTPSRNHDSESLAATTMESTTAGCSLSTESQTSVHASTVTSHHGIVLTPFSPPRVGSVYSTDEAEQQQRNVPSSSQHMAFGSPVVATAPIARKPPAVHQTIPLDAAHKPERPIQTPVLTADTVLPVATREDEACRSSSATTTHTLSRSNSRAQQSSSASLSRSTISANIATDKASAGSAAASGAGRVERVGVVQTAGSLSTCTSAAHEGRPRDKSAATLSLGKVYPSARVPTPASSASASLVDPGTLSSPKDVLEPRGASVSSASTGTASSGRISALSMFAGYSFTSSQNQMQRYIDQWCDRFEEDKNAYKEGGYLSVTPGRIFHARYVLIQKIGYGEFSTVWLGYDTKHFTTNRSISQAFVAVKVAKCRSIVQEVTAYEVSLLRYLEARLPKHVAITNIIDCFDVRGEFGMHTCMVLPLCGPNLLSVIERMKADQNRRNAADLRMIKEIIISVLISLHELSVLNVLHTDIKPENVLCLSVDSKLMNMMEKFCGYNQERSHMIGIDQLRESMVQQRRSHLVCLADFGLSALLEPPSSAPSWMSMCGNVDKSLLAPLMRCKRNFPVTRSGIVDNQRGTLIQTREYRAPEVLLGLDFTCATDIWSVGCMAFELITGHFLMDPKKTTRDQRQMDIEHLAMMMRLIGPLPPEIRGIRVRNNDYYDAVAQGKQLPKSASLSLPEYLHRFVDRAGNLICASHSRWYPSRDLVFELKPYLGFAEARMAADFILSCLGSFDPKQRPSAKQLLGHQWFGDLGHVLKKVSPL